jgi:iron complex transport system substrate-binding protein
MTHPNVARRYARPLLALATAALVVAACGSDKSASTEAPQAATTTAANAAPATVDSAPAVATTTGETSPANTTQAPVATDAPSDFPVTVQTATGDITVAAKPVAIISLSATATEMLFAMNAGPQVIAVDDQSNFPADAPMTDLSSYEPNIEAIAAKNPDLVVVANKTPEIVDGLGALDIPVVVMPAAVTLDDVYAQIEQLGAITGNLADSVALSSAMQSDIDALVASIPKRTEPLTFFHELDDTLYSATSATFIGQLYTLAGLTNVADAADPDGANGGYPQLSAEYLATSDPDLIFLADTKCCQQNAASVAARPGFGELSAVKNGNVIELDDDVASRWGPRVIDLLRAIVDATAKVPA